MGSVKDLEIIKKPIENQMGIGRFVFSDRYSVFDWGEMPDTIEDKGAALCLMGARCFEEAELAYGIKTHYQGLVEHGKVINLLDALKEPTNVMQVSLVNVIRPEIRDNRYDYSRFNPSLVNFLIPLEIIYRNSLPEGSSVFKRLKTGETTLKKLGLKENPKPGYKPEKPIFEVSTKLESTDRYLDWEEAQKIAGLEYEEVVDIQSMLDSANQLITDFAKKSGLVNEDGKIELAYDNKRDLMLVDILGTLDECRFTYNGNNVSKEVARQFYKKTRWYEDVQKAKEQDAINWKKLCKSQPPALDPNLKRIISSMYTSTANVFLGRKIFNAPELGQVVKEYEAWLKVN